MWFGQFISATAINIPTMTTNINIYHFSEILSMIIWFSANCGVIWYTEYVVYAVYIVPITIPYGAHHIGPGE